MGKQWKQWQTLFSWARKSLRTVTSVMKVKDVFSLGGKAMMNLDSILKRHRVADKSPYNQSHCFSSSHIWMWELDHKECWVLKNWCFWTVVLEKTLDSHLNCKEIKPLYPKGNQPWILVGGTDAEIEAPIPQPSDTKSQFIWKEPDAGKDWRQEEKGMTENEIVEWHHRLNGHEFG